MHIRLWMRLKSPRMKTIVRVLNENQSVGLLVMGALGVFLGVVVALCGEPKDGGALNPRASTKLPEFWTVFVLMVTYTTVLAVLFVPLWCSLLVPRQILLAPSRRSAFADVFRLVLVLVSGILIFSPPFIDRVVEAMYQVHGEVPEGFLPVYFREKIFLLALLGMFSFLPAAIGAVLIPVWMRRDLEASRPLVIQEGDLVLPREKDVNPNSFLSQNELVTRLVGQYLSDHERLGFYLRSAGVIVSVITLFAGALRVFRDAVAQNLCAAPVCVVSKSPVILTLLLGFYWSAVVGLFYGIGYFSLLRSGRELRDWLCPLKKVSTLEQDFERRRKIGDILLLNISYRQRLQNSVIILAPIIAGLVSILLSGKVSK